MIRLGVDFVLPLSQEKEQEQEQEEEEQPLTRRARTTTKNLGPKNFSDPKIFSDLK